MNAQTIDERCNTMAQRAMEHAVSCVKQYGPAESWPVHMWNAHFIAIGLADSIIATRTQEPPANTVSCGCCSSGCCCHFHQDRRIGVLPNICGYHAAQAAREQFVRFGSDGQRVQYEDAADASEHMLRMAEGLC